MPFHRQAYSKNLWAITFTRFGVSFLSPCRHASHVLEKSVMHPNKARFLTHKLSKTSSSFLVFDFSAIQTPSRLLPSTSSAYASSPPLFFWQSFWANFPTTVRFRREMKSCSNGSSSWAMDWPKALQVSAAAGNSKSFLAEFCCECKQIVHDTCRKVLNLKVVWDEVP